MLYIPGLPVSKHGHASDFSEPMQLLSRHPYVNIYFYHGTCERYQDVFPPVYLNPSMIIISYVIHIPVRQILASLTTTKDTGGILCAP